MCGFIENKKQIDTRYGKRNIRTAFVADTSGTIKLVLWEENIDKVVQGEFYRIENVLSSSFKGSIQLTTTQQTTFHTIEPLINVKEDFEHLEILETTYMGKVDYCTFKTQYKCLHCQRALTEGPGEDTKQSTTVKCASCGVKQRYSTEQMMSQIKFQFSTVDGKKLNMVMFSNEIEKFKYDNNLMQKSNDEVEDFLLCQACMTIKTNADSDIVNTCTIQLQ